MSDKKVLFLSYNSIEGLPERAYRGNVVAFSKDYVDLDGKSKGAYEEGVRLICENSDFVSTLEKVFLYCGITNNLTSAKVIDKLREANIPVTVVSCSCTLGSKWIDRAKRAECFHIPSECGGSQTLAKLIEAEKKDKL